MSTFGFRSRFSALGALLALGATGSPLFAQTPPKVALKEIVDDRYGGGKTEGGLVVVLKLDGSDLESYPAGRAFLKAAKDDSGRSLLPRKPAEPAFRNFAFSSGLRLDLASPSRGSRSVTVSGTVELFAPKRDPAAVVKVPKALRKLDTPLDAPGLKAAKLQVTPLSEARYAEEQKKQESPEAKERFRKEMKAEGMSDEEIEAAFELRAAFKELGSSGEGKGAVVLLLREEDFRKVQAVSFLDEKGNDIHSNASSSDTDGVVATRRFQFAEPPGPETTIVFTLYTDKAKLSVPFELKDVPLP